MDKLIFDDFKKYLQNRKNFSSNTINSYERDLKKILIYLETTKKNIDISSYNWVCESTISEYIEYLREKKYSSATLARTVSAVHIFSDYLYDEGIIEVRPSIDIRIDKDNSHDLVVFTREEISRILNIDAVHLNDYRDKAIFELSYSIGIKPTECINLEMKDINLEIGYLKYRKKDGYRTVALNSESVNAIKDYLDELEKHNVDINGDSKLFLNHDGEGISRQGYWKIFKKRQNELGLSKELNTMNFRNSLAIHLLEDGVPVQDVQEILGLKNIHSLKAYLKNMKKLRTVKRMVTNHPRKAMK